MKIRYGEITKDVLIMLAVAGMFAVAATSPYFLINIVRGIAKNKKYNKKYHNFNENSLLRSLSGLNKNKIVIIKKEGDRYVVRLTEKGKKIAQEILFDNIKIEKPKIWDKKWRVVIFDVPENKRRRTSRNNMRHKLQSAGFFQLQKSVWVHPYPCQKEIQLICEVYGTSPFVNIITAENIYNDDELKKYFKL